MKLTIKNLSIKNFKGISQLDIDFLDVTNIYGANETGKTTVVDAFTWLLFNKNSSWDTDFNIKPLESTGEARHNVESEVEATLLEDNREIKLKKVYAENWTKKRGEQVPTLTGHTTSYWFDDVPVKKKEYEDKINNIIDENLFKLITNPKYFESLHWKEKRDIIFKLIPEIKNEDVADGNKSFLELIEVINQGKTLEEYRKSITAKKNKQKEALEQIPVRIEEVNRNKPEPLEFETIAKEIEQLKNDIANIDTQISDKNKANESANKDIREKQNEYHRLKSQLNEKKSEIESRIWQDNNKKNQEHEKQKHQLEQLKNELDNIKTSIKNIDVEIKEYNDKIDEIRQEWKDKNSEEIEIDPENFVCPTCKREYDTEDKEKMKEEMIANFNNKKQSDLDTLKDRATKLKDHVSEQNKYKEEKKAKQDEVQEKIDSFDIKPPEFTDSDVALEQDKEYQELKSKVENFVVSEQKETDNSLLQKEKSNLQSELEEKQKQYSVKDEIEKDDRRIEELKEEQKKISQEIAELEKIEFNIESFEKKKVSMIEEKVNAKFQYVKFKMYNQLINGGQEPTCVTLISGVPYSDANNAAKINAGIDIINTLSEYYDIYAPIFIDNRESVTELLETNSQIINLYVNKEDKELRIEN